MEAMEAVDKAILEDVEETSAAHAVDEANVALTRSELESLVPRALRSED